MKKRVFSLILALILCMIFTISAAAADIPRCSDTAGLLSEAELAELNTKLDRISEELLFDVAVITVNDLNGDDPDDFADWVWQNYGYGFNDNSDGVLLLLDMGGRTWGMFSFGAGKDLLPVDTLDFIGGDIVPFLSDGDYARAFNLYADECEEYVRNWDEQYDFNTETNDYHSNDSYYEEDYGCDSYEKPRFNIGFSLFISLAVGAVVGLIVTGAAKSKLKSVAAKTSASDYIIGGLNITDARERFLYRNVSRVPRPQPQQRSSSGGVHMGGGRGGSSGHVSAGGKF